MYYGQAQPGRDTSRARADGYRNRRGRKTEYGEKKNKNQEKEIKKTEPRKKEEEKTTLRPTQFYVDTLTVSPDPWPHLFRGGAVSSSC